MTISIELPTPTSTVCEPVRQEFGNPVSDPASLALMQNPELESVIADISDQLAHTYGRPGELETGVAAGRVLKALGCASCQLQVCAVKGALQEKITMGDNNNTLTNKMNMLASAPTWLRKARLQESEADPRSIPTTTKAVLAAMDDGTFDPDKLLAGTTNKPEALYTKDSELPPELQAFRNLHIKEGEPLHSHRITTDKGYEFIVTDASPALSFKGEPVPSQEYRQLVGKLLKRMKAGDTAPHILTADNTSQKVIQKVGKNSTMFEIRMGGSKNRLYFVATPASNGEPIRLSIIGSHGGDAATQQEFIDKAALLS